MNREFGGRNPEIQNTEMSDLTSNWQSIFSHITSSENGPLLEKLVTAAEQNFPGDASWLDKMRGIQRELESVDPDDEDGIREILENGMSGVELLEDEYVDQAMEEEV